MSENTASQIAAPQNAQASRRTILLFLALALMSALLNSSAPTPLYPLYQQQFALSSVSLGLIGWAGFLGCTAYFACPQGGLKGLLIGALTCCSGVFWAMAIIHGSELAPQWELLGYLLTGVVAFLMCIQAKQQWLGFVPGTFIGACATFAGGGDWPLVTLSLLVGLLFGYAMKNSGLWWAARSEKARAAQPVSPNAGSNGAAE